MRFRALLVLAIAVANPTKASAFELFDNIGVPADTSGGGNLTSFTDADNVFESLFSTAASRFTLNADAQGVTLSHVVFSSGPDLVTRFTPSEWSQVNFLVEVWDENPAFTDDPRRGNVFTSDGATGEVQRTIVSGNFNTAWSTVSLGVIPTYLVELDISDIFLEGGEEYWIAVRTKLSFSQFGRTLAVSRNPVGVPLLESESDIWTSHIVGTATFPPFSGNQEDRWVSLSGFDIDKWAYALNLDVISDYDDDGDVDGGDLGDWEASFGIDDGADGDFDGDTDGADLLVWQRQFGSDAVPPLASGSGVPEPSAAALMLLGGVLANSASRRRQLQVRRSEPDRQPR